MKHFILILSIFSSLNTFSQDVKYRFSRTQNYESFRLLDSVGIIIVPISWGNNAKFNDIKINGNRRTKNFLFYDPINEKQELLFKEEKQYITEFFSYLLNYRSPSDTTPKPKNWKDIYYRVKNDDYNHDKKLDINDPTYLYKSNFDGSGLMRISPEGYDLKYYQYIKKNNIILATLIQDDNNDKKFNSQDSEVLYRIDLNDLSKSKIITYLKIKEKDN